MKLHELDQLTQQDKAQQVLETRLGQTVLFAKLSLRESRHMLLRVRGLLSEHRSSIAFHSSERDPAYLKLVMIESGLKGRLKEAAPVDPAVAAVAKKSQAGQSLNPQEQEMLASAGAAAVSGKPAAASVAALDLKDPKLMAIAKKSQSGQTLSPEEKTMMAAAGTAAAMQKESQQARRRLRESEIQQAQVVLAAQDMVDQVQKMLEQISAMQFKDLPALTDTIKNDMGVDQASAYQSATAAVLTQLLQAIQTGKTALEGAQGTLTGEPMMVPGQEPVTDPAVDLNAEPEMDADMDADAAAAPVDPQEPTELGAPEALGRERRVAEAMKARPDYIDLDKDGDKKESMKQAAADKKAGSKKVSNPFAKKK